MLKKGTIFCLMFYLGLIGNASAGSIKLSKLVVIPKKTTIPNNPITYSNINNGEIKLPYKQNDFYIYFETDDSLPSYRYKLDEWNVVYEGSTANKYIFFSNIPSGRYNFTVWSEHDPKTRAGLLIQVESPIWLQWWFLPMLFVYALILMSALFFFVYQYRVRQLIRIHSIRENIARDLHDDIGSYLSSISVLSQSIISIINSDSQKALMLTKKIGEIAREMLDTMGDIIWSINPDNDSMTHIFIRMRDVGVELFEELDIKFAINLDENLLLSHLPLEKRHDFFLIYKEALNNIAKHSEARNVIASVRKQDHLLVLVIEDDGVGFEREKTRQKVSTGGNGLKNMHARAKSLGGEIEILSSVNRGTTVILKVLTT